MGDLLGSPRVAPLFYFFLFIYLNLRGGLSAPSLLLVLGIPLIYNNSHSDTRIKSYGELKSSRAFGLLLIDPGRTLSGSTFHADPASPQLPRGGIYKEHFIDVSFAHCKRSRSEDTAAQRWQQGCSVRIYKLIAQYMAGAIIPALMHRIPSELRS